MTPRTDRACKSWRRGTINSAIFSMSRGMSCRVPGEDLPVYHLPVCGTMRLPESGMSATAPARENAQTNVPLFWMKQVV